MPNARFAQKCCFFIGVRLGIAVVYFVADHYRAMPLCTDRKLEHRAERLMACFLKLAIAEETSIPVRNLGNSVFVAKRRSVASGLLGYSQSVEAPCVMLPTGGPQSGTRPPENWEERQSS